LTHGTEREFFLDDDTKEAIEKLKSLVESAPVLVHLDYDITKLIAPQPRESDHGLMFEWRQMGSLPTTTERKTSDIIWIVYVQRSRVKILATKVQTVQRLQSVKGLTTLNMGGTFPVRH
jgi:hypothetical protein